MSSIQRALCEIKRALTSPHLWLILGWYDIKQRYRRSVLGPFWLTLSTGVLIGTLGLLWSKLFKTNLHEYMPFFAIGHVIWVYFSTQINEACTGFTQFEHIIKQINLPLPIYLLRLMVRNLIVLAHNFVIIFIVIVFIGQGWHPSALLAIPGMLIMSLTLLFVSMILAIICTRFRDIPPIIQNLVAISFYLTPILWQPQQLNAQHRWVAQDNPLNHLFQIVRAPILGITPSMDSWLIALGVMLLSAVVAIPLFARYRHRIAYWL